MNYRTLLTTLVVALPVGAAVAASGFLADYSKLKTVTTATGTDQIYTAPGALTRLVAYSAVMIDEPEIHFSADSEYKGMKPEDVLALSAFMRDAIKKELESGGYVVVEKPAGNALYVRSALTELYLKKKKRKLLQYTPLGAVTKLGMDALKDTLDKVDIIEMTLEAELTDSTSGDLLGELTAARGARKAEDQKEQRMDMDTFAATIGEYAGRLRCHLDNSKLPEARWIDCMDPEARKARAGKTS